MTLQALSHLLAELSVYFTILKQKRNLISKNTLLYTQCGSGLG